MITPPEKITSELTAIFSGGFKGVQVVHLHPHFKFQKNNFASEIKFKFKLKTTLVLIQNFK